MSLLRGVSSGGQALTFSFGGQEAKVDCRLIALNRFTSSPVLAFTDASLRAPKYLRRGTGSATGDNDEMDPLNAALLIALAQAKARTSISGDAADVGIRVGGVSFTRGSAPTLTYVVLQSHLLTPTPNRDGYYHYTAMVPSSYLRCLEDLYEPLSAGLEIFRFEVPYLDDPKTLYNCVGEILGLLHEVADPSSGQVDFGVLRRTSR